MLPDSKDHERDLKLPRLDHTVQSLHVTTHMEADSRCATPTVEILGKIKKGSSDMIILSAKKTVLQQQQSFRACVEKQQGLMRLVPARGSRLRTKRKRDRQGGETREQKKERQKEEERKKEPQ
jgi:hypothetical protein